LAQTLHSSPLSEPTSEHRRPYIYDFQFFFTIFRIFTHSIQHEITAQLSTFTRTFRLFFFRCSLSISRSRRFCGMIQPNSILYYFLLALADTQNCFCSKSIASQRYSQDHIIVPALRFESFWWAPRALLLNKYNFHLIFSLNCSLPIYFFRHFSYVCDAQLLQCAVSYGWRMELSF
jgi:hypothetical protein